MVAAVLAAGCTDAGLHRNEGPPPAPPEDTITVQGSFCTEDPETLKFPVKIWFIIDDSGSMQNNDPNQRRYEAAKELANALQDPDQANPAMFFGAERFADQGASRITQPDRFTPSAAVFNANIAAVQNPGNGGTPYTSALNFAVGELNADILASGVEARRTRYVVIFLSDGAPNGPGDPDGILPGVENLMSLKDRAGDVTVNTIFLGGDMGAQQILMQMAQAGNGIFRSFPNGDDIDYADFDFSSIRRNFNQRFFLVTNRNAMPTRTGHQADSDRDGIPDGRERDLGTDPSKRDTDADGCGDLMESRDAGWDPLIPGSENNQCVCTEETRTADTDFDGLTDCEEKWLASSSLYPDADKNEDDLVIGDLVPDGLDHTYLNDLLFPNDGMDFDADGVQDLAELRTHMSPHHSDGDIRSDWAYEYDYLDQQPDNARCYDFRVENVSVMPTLTGENEILVYFAQSPQDNAQKEKSFRIARKTVAYSAMVDVVLVPEDFSELLIADPVAE